MSGRSRSAAVACASAPRALAARFVVALVALFAALPACGSLQKSAAKDPMKCERDPKCAQKQKANDCSSQCTDDPECVRRCEEVQRSTGGSQR